MRKILFLIFLFSCREVSDGLRERLIIWNVGQGLWTTVVTSTTCFHFDMGGELSPLDQVLKVCQKKQSRAYFSHWDWDHISFARSFFQKANLCLAALSGGEAPSKKALIFKEFKVCDSDSSKVVKEVTGSREKKKTANASSRIFVAFNSVLFPGDSPSSQEKIWSQNLFLYRYPILILGHHGSKTSTSEILLRKLGRLRLAIASARAARYGHPHPDVLFRLKRFKAPTLSTESWGSILIEL